MKTVLMICPFARPNIGGVESHLEKLMAYLSGRGFRVILVTYQPLTTKVRAEPYEKRDNVEVYRARWFGNGWVTKLEPYFPLVFLYLFPGLFLKRLAVDLKRGKEVDPVHAHGFVAAAIARALPGISRKRRVVSTHAIYGLKRRKLLAALVRRLLDGFDTILAVGEPSRRELVDIGLGDGRIKVHPNWIDTDTFRVLDRAECRKTLKLDPGEFVVLFLGRLMEMKGVKILLEAANGTDREIRVLFVGDGPPAGGATKAAGAEPR